MFFPPFQSPQAFGLFKIVGGDLGEECGEGMCTGKPLETIWRLRFFLFEKSHIGHKRRRNIGEDKSLSASCSGGGTGFMPMLTRNLGPESRGSKALVFLRVWSFNAHAPYILSADDSGDLSGISWDALHWRPTIPWEHAVEKVMATKMQWTLLFPLERNACRLLAPVQAKASRKAGLKPLLKILSQVVQLRGPEQFPKTSYSKNWRPIPHPQRNRFIWQNHHGSLGMPHSLVVSCHILCEDSLFFLDRRAKGLSFLGPLILPWKRLIYVMVTYPLHYINCYRVTFELMI